MATPSVAAWLGGALFLRATYIHQIKAEMEQIPAIISSIVSEFISRARNV